MAKAKQKSTVIERAKKFFDRVVAYEAEQRKAEIDDIRFVGLLDQWPANIKQIREQDPQGARPCLVVDKVNQYKNQIVNNIRQNRAGIKVRPIDDSADIEVAEVYQGIVRHIEDRSKADIAYDWAAEGAVVSGLGYFRVLTEYVGDSFEQDIRIERIKNRFTVYFDDTSTEPDGSDAQQVIITELVDREVFKEMYPNANPCDWATATGDNQNKWVTPSANKAMSDIPTKTHYARIATHAKKKIKDAGMSIGLLYGKGGPGGASMGAPGGNVSAPNAPNQGSEIMGMQMLQAQKRLIEAQANKTEVEAKKIGGVDTEEAETRIKSLTQGIENQKAVQQLTQIETDIAEIEKNMKDDSYEDTLASIRIAAKVAERNFQLMSNELKISDETLNAKIAIVQGELIGIGIENRLKEAQIKKTDQEIKASIASISQGWRSLSIQDRNAITNMLNAETARTNAQTNVREFLESVRKTDYDYEVKRGILELQRFLHNVSEGDKLTVGTLQSILGAATRAKPK